MKLFNQIYCLLPQELISDVVFNSIKDTLEKYLENYDIVPAPINYIHLAPSMFKTLDIDAIKEEHRFIKIDKAETDDNLVYSMLTSDKFTFILKVKKTSDKYVAAFSVMENTYNSPTKKISYEYEKQGDTVSIVETCDISSGSYYYDYSYDIKVFNSGRELEIDKERALDKDFLCKFSVPVNLVREYRQNFKKYKDEINRYSSIGINEAADDMYENQWEMIRYSSYDMFENYLKSEAYNFDRYKKIITSFEQIKPMLSGEFAISKNTLDGIAGYLFEFNLVVQSRGVIITKENDEYKLYYIIVSDDSLVVSPTEISSEKAKELYEKGIDYIPSDDYYGDDLEKNI